MEITQAVRKGQKVLIESVELNDAVFLNEINGESSQGLLVTLDNKELYFIDNTNYFVELKATMEAIKEFLNTFASAGIIGSNSGGPVTADPTLAENATKINSELTNLINKIP